MAYDLEEQEQIAQIKAFWEKWGTLITGVVVAGAIAYFGWQGYGWYQKRQVAQAEAAFASFNASIQKKDADLAPKLAGLQGSFGKTNYASLASLQMAAVLATDGKYDQAQAPLQWVIEHGQTENQGAARLRLADIQMQLNQKDAALKTLDTPVAQYASVFAAKKADIYMMSGDTAKAQEVLKAAIETAKKAQPADLVTVESLEAKLKLLPH